MHLNLSLNLYIKTLVLLVLAAFYTHSQNTSNEQVKRLQRAIFIYNFANQVQFNDNNDNPDFKIGVLGNDRTFIDLKGLSKKRTIKDRPVTVIQFNAVKDITDVDLIYTNNKFNFDVDYILNKISGNNTLLVTEDYPYNTSMINIVNVGDSFEYEINEDIMNAHNLTAPLTLRKHAINNVERWKQLFQNTEEVLNQTEAQLGKAQENIKQQGRVIENKNETIASQQNTIRNQNNQINSVKKTLESQDAELLKLTDISEFHKKKYSEKLEIESELEARVKAQVENLRSQQLQIKESNDKIAIQDSTITSKLAEIAKKEAILKDTDSKLNTQRTITYLLLALFGLAIISGLLLYKNYRAIKTLNKELELKNDDIYNQSLVLESKNKELEQFAYITSHDLKEPLTTITGLVNLLKDDYAEKLDEDALMSFHFISQSSERMRDQIDSLLEYSKLGKAKAKTEINCNTVVNEIVGDLGNIIKRSEAQVNYTNLPMVKASKIEIRTLFQNLINNAIKFRRQGVPPIVNISYKTIVPEHQHQEFYEFAIEDNGIGIEDKHKEKVFAIFQRLHGRDEFEGSGIGLAYVKKIVEALGGRIWFDSELGKGTTFRFTIPV